MDRGMVHQDDAVAWRTSLLTSWDSSLALERLDSI